MVHTTAKELQAVKGNPPQFWYGTTVLCEGCHESMASQLTKMSGDSGLILHT